MELEEVLNLKKQLEDQLLRCIMNFEEISKTKVAQITVVRHPHINISVTVNL